MVKWGVEEEEPVLATLVQFANHKQVLHATVWAGLGHRAYSSARLTGKNQKVVFTLRLQLQASATGFLLAWRRQKQWAYSYQTTQNCAVYMVCPLYRKPMIIGLLPYAAFRGETDSFVLLQRSRTRSWKATHTHTNTSQHSLLWYTLIYKQ